MVEVEAPCASCGKLTRHRGDNAGALHCVPCVLSSSVPPPSKVTPENTSVVAMPEGKPRRSTAEIIAAIVTVAILGFLVYAFIRGV